MNCIIRHSARPPKGGLLVSKLDLREFLLAPAPLDAYPLARREKANLYLPRCRWHQCLVNSSTRIGCCVAWVVSMMIFDPMDTGAVGFRMPNQDPEGIARGNAFVATADNPSAIYYNPAGITQLEGDQLN